MTFEELFDSILADQIASSAATGNPARPEILVQAHCHQRSLVGIGPMLKLLRSIPGAQVIDLDAGCCGMAGSFGYESRALRDFSPGW